LALTAAPRLLQAGVGLVIATSNDLIQWGENAYNFVNDNGELLISFADGNLDGAKLSKACNTNFKLLTTVLKSTLAETYDEDLLDAEKDFLDILSDWTQEQVAELNKSVNELIQDRLGSKYELLDSDLEYFAERIKEIASSGNDPEQYLIHIGKWMIYDEGEVTILVFKANHTGTVTEYIIDQSYEGGLKKEGESQMKWKLSGDTLSITATDEDGETKTIVLKFSIKEGAFHLTDSNGETEILYPYKNGQGFP